MTDSDKRRPDPNATIQIDQLDGLDDVRLDEARPGRRMPPPLPPTETVSNPPASAAANKPSAGKTIGIVAMFVVLVGVAIALGLLVGKSARGTAAAAQETSAAPASASPSASPSIMTLPPVDIR